MSDTNRLRGRIAEELNRQPTDIVVSPSLSLGLIINREINSAIHHYVSTRFRWNEVRESEFVTTSLGQRTYSLPASFVKMDTIKVIYNNAYIPLEPRTWEYIEHKDRLVTGTQGVPFEYTIYGNVLRVYPSPNAALTLAASFIQRTLPTSLTGSYCEVMTMGGGSMTSTTTASHNNRLDGWTTDGEELIRTRAIAAVEINYFKNEKTINQMLLLNGAREPYYSLRERLAFERLVDEAQDVGATGRLQSYAI